MKAHRRSGPVETIASLAVLLVLSFIAVFIFAGRLRDGSAVFGVGAVQTAAVGQRRWAEMDIGGAAGEGFRPFSGPRVYNSDTLYEKIDGKADFYISSGFEALFTQRFISDTDPQICMELYVYDMGRPQNAFSVYSLQKRADTKDFGAATIQYGYSTENSLHFVCGGLYVEIVGSSQAVPLQAAMRRTATVAAGELNCEQTHLTADMDLLDGEGLVQGSVKLYLDDAFGYEKFEGVYTARYNVGNRPATAFVVRTDSAEHAVVLCRDYSRFLVENGGEPIALPEGELSRIGAQAIDFYGRTELVFAAGVFVAGAHDCPDKDIAVELAAVILDNVRGRGRAGGSQE